MREQYKENIWGGQYETTIGQIQYTRPLHYKCTWPAGGQKSRKRMQRKIWGGDTLHCWHVVEDLILNAQYADWVEKEEGIKGRVGVLPPVMAHQPTIFFRQVLHLIFHLEQLSSDLQQIRRRVHGGCFLNFCGEPAGLSSGRCVAAASTFGSMARLWGEGWGDWGELGGHRGEAILP